MIIELPDELVHETIEQLTEQINIEMEESDPCPGIGVPSNHKYPWYVELRNKLQEQVTKPETVVNQFLGSRESCEDKDAWDDMLTAMGGDDE
jgi:hypothetical protein